MAKFKVGDKVYIKELDKTGVVHSLSFGGEVVSHVTVKYPDGDKIIEVLNKTIEVAGLVQIIAGLFKNIWTSFRSIFRRKKSS